MATKSIEQLSERRIVEFVTAARVARMATAEPGGAPHAIPICYWFDGTNFYFAIDEKPKRATGAGLKRMRNIASNPRVALIIDHYEEDWSQLAYVLVHGTARVVEDSEEYMLALRHLRDKYRQYRTMALSPDRNPIVRIEPERVHVWGARFGAPGTDAARAR
jgi:coenzyme F420-0:L-glutamate ligase/coenzyme F420-1:gamma-L-glutamate ligase